MVLEAGGMWDGIRGMVRWLHMREGQAMKPNRQPLFCILLIVNKLHKSECLKSECILETP